MRYAAIMVYVDNGSHAAARVNLACEIAAAFEASVIGASASVPMFPVMAPSRFGPVAGPVLTPPQQAAEADLGYSEALFRQAARAFGRPIEWRCSMDHPARFLSREARAADLVVVGQIRNEVAPYSLANPSDMLLEIGRPLLVVPPAVGIGPLGSRAIVAWKDSREARRAVQDATPILRKSSRVDVVEIAPAGDLEAARFRTSDVATYLSRHGVRAEGRALLDDGDGPTPQLLALARGVGAGLIVMGGQGHTRLREWTFGGDTYRMLKKSPICVLLSS
ncbi:universal stress protein [Labrys monachus]|uniref:Nucleotide-binding universal stress UspA family protein n=1 Tax=Labrys monachus TaxID=217067 RepID=A0ABU0F911_9HYPH|nr:universal stress protein [Labrys monachus]MDQ0391093.1 nucleotide-binding universal stress UspA family protein [Labrys monachus]